MRYCRTAENSQKITAINLRQNYKENYMKYGYCRVSISGQDLKEQEEALVALGVPKANIFEEKISGVIRSGDRPQFGKLLKKIQAGDELVVMKLHRLKKVYP